MSTLGNLNRDSERETEMDKRTEQETEPSDSDEEYLDSLCPGHGWKRIK